MSSNSRFVWPGALLLSFIVAYFLLLPFISVIILGLLMAFMFYPVYKWFGAKIKSSSLNVALTTLVSLLLIAVPVTFVLFVTVNQAVDLANDLANSEIIVDGEDFVSSLDSLTVSVNEKIESLVGIQNAIATEDVDAFLSTTLPQLAKTMASLISSIVSGIPNFFTMFIVYLFVFTSGLTYGKQLRSLAESLSPFGKKINQKYMMRLGSMAKAMLKGQFIIALLQGVVSAAVLSFIGFANYFWVMAVIFTFLSFIPLGAGIITIPLGLVLLLIGDFVGGLVVLLNHFIVITNIDNIIRPKVVPKNAQLPAVLTILGAFGGVSLFGLIGVVYGPMLMIFITTTIESYLEYKNTVT